MTALGTSSHELWHASLYRKAAKQTPAATCSTSFYICTGECSRVLKDAVPALPAYLFLGKGVVLRISPLCLKIHGKQCSMGFRQHAMQLCTLQG